jgi:hypothetical protein
MENPDAEVEVRRDEKGNIIGLAFKVNKPGEGDINSLMISALTQAAFDSEGPEDHSTQVDVNCHIGV